MDKSISEGQIYDFICSAEKINGLYDAKYKPFDTRIEFLEKIFQEGPEQSESVSDLELLIFLDNSSRQAIKTCKQYPDIMQKIREEVTKNPQKIYVPFRNTNKLNAYLKQKGLKIEAICKE